ncbi:HTATIP2 [Branchiostoma lanceolatum]|uniref:Protein HTATIP2 n=1 Tax=Branchiostoma lanceolatum TaxID=7740 RepID=A0A8K0EF52_BRALA|nr:HTATIP2 [Branchiostoma lanceolatum]
MSPKRLLAGRPEMQIGATVFAGFVVFLGIIIAWLEVTPIEGQKGICRMAEAASGKEDEFRSTNQTAFVVGHTGETGRALVEELVNRNIFQKLLLIGRRELNYEGEKYSKLEQKVVDYEKLADDHADLFKGHNVGFCCLGTTRGKSGAEGFKRVDHDYVMMTAKLAKEGGCGHFLLQSSQGANKDSSFLYTKVKGQVDAECAELGFEKLSIFRPGVLMVDRKESRPGEWFARKMLTPLKYFAPTVMTCPVETVAKAMVNAVLSPSDKPAEIYENKAVHLLAKGKSC